MKEKMHLKKKDWVLIAIIIVVAGLAFFLHNLLGAKGANCVVVKVDGKIEGTYSLGEDQEISINGGTNTLVINYNYHQNPTDNIGLGGLVVQADAGLAVTSVNITD